MMLTRPEIIYGCQTRQQDIMERRARRLLAWAEQIEAEANQRAAAIRHQAMRAGIHAGWHLTA